MAGETTTTITGNLVGDPEMRYIPSGAAVVSFVVASTPRTFDKAANEWKDGYPLYMNCSVWRQMAEHVAESLNKGDRVIVTGRLKSRTFETREGEKRTVIELDVDEVGPSLRYATAKVTKAERGGAAGGEQHGTHPRAAAGARSTARPDGVPDDPWSAPVGAGAEAPPF